MSSSSRRTLAQEFDLRGTVLRVTLDVFGASSMTVSAEEVAAPTWLPGPESDAEFPERRLDIWTVLDEGTITEHLRAEITWLRSLSRAIERGYTARALQIVSSNPESLGERLSRPPLHLAVIREDRGMVESFLSHGADIATIDGSDRTALHYAAGRGNIELTALLVERARHSRRRTAPASRRFAPLSPRIRWRWRTCSKSVALALMPTACSVSADSMTLRESGKGYDHLAGSQRAMDVVALSCGVFA